ncbi:MAG: alpha/beta hydrolase fold domain-containing protein [Rubrimonas sp.]
MTGVWLDRLADPPSPETAAFNDRLERTLADMPATHEVPPEMTRAARAEGRGILPFGGPMEGAGWTPAPLPAGRARLIRPEGPARGLVVHVHGGGWTLGAPDQFDRWNLGLSRDSGAAVISLPYRLAPENPWPAPIDDVVAGLAWALGAAGALAGAGRIVVTGESAGAHLALLALQRLRGTPGFDRIAGASLFYGCYDLRMTPSMARWGARKLVLSTPTVDWFIDNLTAGDRALRADPAASPLLGDVAGLPPVQLAVGTADPLVDDTLFLAGRLAAAGAAPQVHVAPGGVHAFDMFDTALAAEALAARAAFVRACCG